MDLENEHVVVTGGCGDIGTAMVAELSRRGARVSVLDVQPPGAEQFADADVLFAPADVTDRAAVDDALRQARSKHGPVTIAIANAGIVESAPFLDITAEQWSRQLDINLTGAFHVAQAVARGMVADASSGHIIFTGSWVGQVPWPEIAAYSVTKAGLVMLARSAARELAVHRIRVNVVAPGIVRAGMAKHQLETEPQYARRVATVIPLGELQTAQQVAEVTGFLCSPAASYLTGSVLLADGGCSLFQFD